MNHDGERREGTFAAHRRISAGTRTGVSAPMVAIIMMRRVSASVVAAADSTPESAPSDCVAKTVTITCWISAKTRMPAMIHRESGIVFEALTESRTAGIRAVWRAGAKLVR